MKNKKLKSAPRNCEAISGTQSRKSSGFLGEKIKNFLKDFWWKFLLFVLLTGCIWFICYKIQITLSREHLFWIFSTVMQSFVALGALLGMLGVFRLQVINKKIENLTVNPRDKMKYFEGTPEDVLINWQRLSEGVRSSFPEVQSEIDESEKLISDKKNIKKQVIDFVWKIVTITALALIFLIITPTLIKIHAGIASLGLVLYLAISSLIATIKLIKEIL